jgi:phosphatidylglycerophosphatase A
MKNFFENKLCLIITTLFGIGYLPLIPGTSASVLAIIFFFLIKNDFYFFLLTAISLHLSFSFTTKAEEIFKEKDCKKIVIDDFSGMLISLLFLPRQIRWAFASFFLFRIFDLLKIYPANKLEKFKGAKGIVGDDLVAAIYTNLVLQLVKLLLKISS